MRNATETLTRQYNLDRVLDKLTVALKLEADLVAEIEAEAKRA